MTQLRTQMMRISHRKVMTSRLHCGISKNMRSDGMVTEAQKRASAKYDKLNTTQVILKLNIHTDADILQKLESVGNKQGYIKTLIRADMKKKRT